MPLPPAVLLALALAACAGPPSPAPLDQAVARCRAAHPVAAGAAFCQPALDAGARSCDPTLAPVDQLQQVLGERASAVRADNELVAAVLSHGAARCVAAHHGLPPGLEGLRASLVHAASPDPAPPPASGLVWFVTTLVETRCPQVASSTGRGLELDAVSGAQRGTGIGFAAHHRCPQPVPSLPSAAAPGAPAASR